MKVKGTCRNCGREFFVQQLFDSEGHCPWCGKPFQPHYTGVLVEALQIVEDAGNTLENALEKIAGMRPSFVLDEDALLSRIEAHLDEIRKGDRSQPS